MTTQHINSLQWHQAMGFARQSCARIFRDGGNPADALEAFGLDADRTYGAADWDKTVEMVAEYLCRQPQERRAA
ncbi:MAG: hypothetical protein KDJ37_13955 [Hyphomicrobiaceae bacterium]|nr:hypothetical protein [Hyphomicrobiaceae bacterium]